MKTITQIINTAQSYLIRRLTMKTITRIINTAQSYGFSAQVSQFDKKTVWIWSECDDIETAPNYDDLYCALGEFSNVDFQTDGDKMEVWIKG